MNTLTKEERVLRVINREEVDYLPSQIVFTDRSRWGEISKLLGLSSEDELDDYLENHLHHTLSLQDKPIFYREIIEESDRLHELGFCNPDWENNIVYDTWGMGLIYGTGTFLMVFHPVQGKATKHNAKYMPPNVPEKALFAKDLKTRVKNYNPPAIIQPGNFAEWEYDLNNNPNNLLIWPTAYLGNYERTYGVMGWEEFMVGLKLYPDVVEELMEKVINYKIDFAKKVVEYGFKIAHHGDDLGTQEAPLWSIDTFRQYILPGLKRVWEVYTKANIPILLHACGKVVDFIPDLIDIGLKILEPAQPCNDLRFLKKEYGKDLIFMGGIDTQILPFQTPKETEIMTRETIQILGKGGGYIIAPSQEIMNDVPVENIKAMVQVIKEEREKVLYM